MKEYSESCDQNRQPILSVIAPLLGDCKSVLEIGSGTGQHAVYFAADLPHLQWQTSDRQVYHPSINAWIADTDLSNVLPPIELDTRFSDWPQNTYDAVYSAKTTHIMHWPDVVAMFNGVGQILKDGGQFLLYGPFNYNNQYTSESNEEFDFWLKHRDPQSGIRDFADLDQLAADNRLSLVKDYAMPANNRLLHWQFKHD